MKLLLVDDEEYVIESIKRNLDLTETGVNEVYTAFSVQQAKNIMGMVDIDIVISDIVMPGGTGFDFVEWVRKEELKVQVIFLTSYAEFDYASSFAILCIVTFPITSSLFFLRNSFFSRTRLCP